MGTWERRDMTTPEERRAKREGEVCDSKMRKPCCSLENRYSSFVYSGGFFIRESIHRQRTWFGALRLQATVYLVAMARLRVFIASKCLNRQLYWTCADSLSCYKAYRHAVLYMYVTRPLAHLRQENQRRDEAGTSPKQTVVPSGGRGERL